MTSTSIPAGVPSQPDAKSSNSQGLERIFGGISLKALEAFCRRMAIGMKSGVDLLRMLGLEVKTGSRRHRN